MDDNSINYGHTILSKTLLWYRNQGRFQLSRSVLRLQFQSLHPDHTDKIKHTLTYLDSGQVSVLNNVSNEFYMGKVIIKLHTYALSPPGRDLCTANGHQSPSLIEFHDDFKLIMLCAQKFPHGTHLMTMKGKHIPKMC